MRALSRIIFFTFLSSAFLAGGAVRVFAQDAKGKTLQDLEQQLQSQQKQIEKLKEQLGQQQQKSDAVTAQIDRYLSKNDQGDWFQEPDTFRAYWKNGLRFETSDKEFKLAIGGRTQMDYGFSHADHAVERDFGNFAGATEYRRARLYIGGSIYKSVDFKAQYDFAGGKVGFKEVWIGVHIPSFAHIQVGSLTEPFSLEQITSDKYETFVERGLTTVFAPDYHVGIMASNTLLDGKLTWQAGLFHPTNGAGNGPTGKNIDLRLAFAPILADKGAHVVHLGVAYSRRYPMTERFAAHPDVHSAPAVIDTGSFACDSENRFGFEGAVVWGPFSAQGEYMIVDTHAPAVGSPTLTGYYIYASYFLTGEHRVYGHGDFGRVKPKHNFVPGGGGMGAWEVALRLDHLNFDSGDLYKQTIQTEGGSRTINRPGTYVTCWTLGLNWYLNPNTRLAMNYVLGHVSEIGGFGSFCMRLQIDF